MPRRDDEAEEEVSLSLIELDRAGARARTRRIAREGLPELPANAEVSERKKEAAQFRAGLAMMWDRERILQETGWSLQKFLAVERWCKEEDERLARALDPAAVWSEYRLQQLQAARELEDLAEIFRRSKQFSALVGAVKARSEILDKIVKTGQDLGLIKRAAREVNITGEVDFTSMSVQELRVHLHREVRGLQDLLTPPIDISSGPAGRVLERVLAPPGEPAPETPPEGQGEVKPRPGRRVKRLAGKKPPDPPAALREAVEEVREVLEEASEGIQREVKVAVNRVRARRKGGGTRGGAPSGS